MKTIPHTPGPWIAIGHTIYDAGQSRVIADTSIGCNDDGSGPVTPLTYAEGEANARLIAAAPALVTALQGVLEATWLGKRRSFEEHREAIDKIQALALDALIPLTPPLPEHARTRLQAKVRATFGA